MAEYSEACTLVIYVYIFTSKAAQIMRKEVPVVEIFGNSSYNAVRVQCISGECD